MRDLPVLLTVSGLEVGRVRFVIGIGNKRRFLIKNLGPVDIPKKVQALKSEIQNLITTYQITRLIYLGVSIKWKPLNVIIFGRSQTDFVKRMITP